MRLEKTREAELDMLYQDEAARIWQQREADWAKERKARERLMQEVRGNMDLVLCYFKVVKIWQNISFFIPCLP